MEVLVFERPAAWRSGAPCGQRHAGVGEAAGERHLELLRAALPQPAHRHRRRRLGDAVPVGAAEG